jgi:hypothetical protein
MAEETPERTWETVKQKANNMFEIVEEESYGNLYVDGSGGYAMQDLIDFAGFAASKGCGGLLRKMAIDDPENYEELDFEPGEIRKTRFRIVYQPEHVEKIPLDAPRKPHKVPGPGM